MNKGAYESLEDAEHRSPFFRMFHSIRTRYSLATAIFLLLCLGIFYVGGRIVLVHLMREAEQQVREIGYDISNLAYKNADRIKRQNAANVASIGRKLAQGQSPLAILGDKSGVDISVLLDFTAEGIFASGAVRDVNGVEVVTKADLQPYEDRISDWITATSSTNDNSAAVGIVQLGGCAHYVALGRYESGRKGYIIIGAPFDSGVFSSQVSEGFSGLDIRVVNRKQNIQVRESEGGTKAAKSDERNQFGIAPMLSEALNFYSGGFWDLGSSPFEAVFAIRDIAGNAISMISVSLPSSFANVTKSALGRLSFFIAMAGILLILPIFWFQSRVLLNPLTRMTEQIRSLGNQHKSVDCPRLDWEGNDEFAMLALSVNSMLETISARSVAVAHAESRQRALIDGIPDGLVVFDRRGKVVSIDKQPDQGGFLEGFPIGDVPDVEFFHGPDVAELVGALGDVFETGRSACVKVSGRAQNAANQQRMLEVRISKLDEAFALAVVRDVTQEAIEHKLRIAAEKHAVEMAKRESMTGLAAGIAHDVNNVLSVILNSAEMGCNERELETIRDAVRRGSAMAKELMTYAGDAKIALLTMAPVDIIEDIKIFVSRVIEKNVALTYDLAEGLPKVDVDPGQIWKVFFNIVKNASEAFNGQPGSIAIAAKAMTMTEELAAEYISSHQLAEGPGVVFTISDDGQGIPGDLLPRLFDPYVSSKSQGRGLGLATVRTIVEAHNGGIKVESHIGRGSVFSIFIPASKLENDVSSAKADKNATATGSEKIVKHDDTSSEVLMIDDDEAILKTTSILLKTLGIVARTAKTREEALGVMRLFCDRISAIILDANLQGADAVRVMKALRTAMPTIPVIVTSGTNVEQVKKIFEESPYDAFLPKPFTVVELKKVLSAVAFRTEK